MASLQELRESLQGLSTACIDISSDKVSIETCNRDEVTSQIQICPVVAGASKTNIFTKVLEINLSL